MNKIEDTDKISDTSTEKWYQQLKKPSWAPPTSLFGIVWSVLYLLILISFGLVFYRTFTGQLPVTIAIPFVLNLFFNLIFTPIQFGLKNNLLAALDILLVWVTIIWMFVVIWPRIPWVVLINLPYLVWVSIATVLQFSITWLNRPGYQELNQEKSN
jgi:translocator protein